MAPSAQNDTAALVGSQQQNDVGAIAGTVFGVLLLCFFCAGAVVIGNKRRQRQQLEKDREAAAKTTHDIHLNYYRNGTFEAANPGFDVKSPNPIFHQEAVNTLAPPRKVDGEFHYSAFSPSAIATSTGLFQMLQSASAQRPAEDLEADNPAFVRREAYDVEEQEEEAAPSRPHVDGFGFGFAPPVAAAAAASAPRPPSLNSRFGRKYRNNLFSNADASAPQDGAPTGSLLEATNPRFNL